MAIPRAQRAISFALIFFAATRAAFADPSEQGGASATWGGPARIGAVAGVAFPRPLSVEAVAGLTHGLIGIEYAVLPAVTLGGARVALWAVAADARIFPFRGPLFVGLRGGLQRLAASDTVALGGRASIIESVAVSTWFINPRVGILWTLKPGVTFGMNAGVEIPVAVTQSTTLPALGSLPPVVSNAIGPVTSSIDMLTERVLPTFDLLELGYVY